MFYKKITSSCYFFKYIFHKLNNYCDQLETIPFKDCGGANFLPLNKSRNGCDFFSRSARICDKSAVLNLFLQNIFI